MSTRSISCRGASAFPSGKSDHAKSWFWRSLGESNLCFSLSVGRTPSKRGKRWTDYTISHTLLTGGGCLHKVGSFLPETRNGYPSVLAGMTLNGEKAYCSFRQILPKIAKRDRKSTRL